MESEKQSNRGGRRLGAGAPQGNWNAFKHGRYSARFRALYEIMNEHVTTATETALEIRIGT